MKNKKVILSSILSLVLCFSLIVGGTFALFTSTTETNIAITSGNVEVVAWLDDIEASTFGEVQAEKNTFELGGSATYDATANKLTIDKIAPGDRVDLNVYIENKSNIAVQYRVKVAFAGGLQDALVANITLPNDETATVLTSTDVATDWKSFNDTNKVTLPMSVALPYDVGNDYMNKSAEITVTVEAIQANATGLIMIGDTKYKTLPEAIAAAENGAIIYLSGVFTLPLDGSLANKKLTLAGIKDGIAVIDMKNVHTGQSTTGTSLTFDGVDVVFDNTADYKGIAHANKVVYKNCTLSGKQTMYATTVEFTSCEFINYSDYCVWTYGTNATFTNCTFTTGGKAILVYNESVTDDTVTVENCIFNSNGQTATDKAAIETGINNADSKHTLIINNSTANGFAANKSNSPLWGNKNNMDGDHLSVTVDGVAQPIYAYVNIDSVADFVAFANAVTDNTQYQGVNVANNSKVYALLNTDIDLAGVTGPATNANQFAIGNGNNTSYCGTFDGQGHTISNLTLGGNWGYTSAMFRTVGDGFTFKNVTVDTVNNVADGRKTSGVAAIVGLSAGGDITFDNVTVKNANLNGRAAVGVLMGGAQQTSVVNITNCSLIDCTVAASTHSNANADYIGAFVGNYQGGATSNGNAPAVINIDASNTVTNCVDGNGTALPNHGQSST